MIATISPEAQHTDESISTCSFAQRVALVKNKAEVNEDVEPELVIRRLRAEVKRLKEEVEFLSGKNDDDCSYDGDENCKLPQNQINELANSVQKYVHDRDESSHLDFCGGITLPKIRAVCAIFKGMLLAKTKEVHPMDDERQESDSLDGEEGNRSFSSKVTAIHVVEQHGAQRGQSQEVYIREKTNRQQKCNDIGGEMTPSVCGVPICSDERVLDEPNVAFSWFKDHYPGMAAINENKNTLKIKYAEVNNCHGCWRLNFMVGNIDTNLSTTLHFLFRPKMQGRG